MPTDITTIIDEQVRTPQGEGSFTREIHADVLDDMVTYIGEQVADPSNIEQDANHQFVTEAQITLWNAKQAALGYTAQDAAKRTTTINTDNTTYPATGAIKGYIDSADAALQSQINSNASAIAGKEPAITAGTSSQVILGDKTLGTLNKSLVGLGNVDNTSDANKPVSTAQQTALDAKVDIDQSYVAVSPVAGVVTLDCGNKQYRAFHVNLNANVTAINITNTATAGEYKIFFIQDATGGRTYTGWSPSPRWGTVGAPVPTVTTNGTVDGYTFTKGPLGNLFFNYKLNW